MNDRNCMASCRRWSAAWFVFAIATGWCATSQVSWAEEDKPNEQAIRLANQGDVEGSLRLLREHLEKNVVDAEARVLLGRILDFDGQPDEAVKVWEAGLIDGEADYPLLMSIGEVRARQGADGPKVTRRRGAFSVSPSEDGVAEEDYKVKHLALAAAAYERVRKHHPADPEAGRLLAGVYSQQQRHDAAIRVWETLVKTTPDNSDYHLQLGLAVQKVGRGKEAVQHLQQAIKLSPRTAEAYVALAKKQAEQGQKDESQVNFARANFYESLPKFSTLEYSDENFAMLEHLNEAGTVARLIADHSAASTELLAILCWSHPHNHLEEQAFDELEARGEKTTPLLQAMLDESQSTCTIKSAGHILARRKVDGTFDYLAQRLPGDLRGYGMDMDIAGSLDDLGDPRAIEPLGELLNSPGDAGEETGLFDRTGVCAPHSPSGHSTRL